MDLMTLIDVPKNFYVFLLQAHDARIIVVGCYVNVGLKLFCEVVLLSFLARNTFITGA